MTPLPSLDRRCRGLAALLVSWAAVLILTPGLGARADMHRYTDDAGRTHIVDDIERIPEKYRDQVKSVATPSAPRAGSSSTKRGFPAKPSYSRAAPSVEIYVTSWCGYCRKLEKFLKAKGIRYKRHDIEKSRSARQRYKSLGGTGVPLVKVGTDVIRGYNPDAILAKMKKGR